MTDGELRRSWWHLDFLWGLDGVNPHVMESGVAFVMITHDDRLARAADRVLVIEHGLVFETDGSLRPARPDR